MKRRTPAQPKRITRSISFETPLLNYLKQQAAEQKRTVNWLVNELIKQELATG